MQHRRPELRTELDLLNNRVRANPNLVVRRDLGRMLNHAEELYSELDRELVESRRLQRYTHAYSELETKLAQQLESVSKWLVWAHLRF